MPPRKPKPAFSVKRILVKNGEFSYYTYRVTGWINGRRIRKQFVSEDEARGEGNRLAVLSANTQRDLHAVNTRLSSSELADAESAIKRLGGTPLSFAAEWFLANYRPPVRETGLAEAIVSFKAAKEAHVSCLVMRDYRIVLKALLEAFPDRCVHQLDTEEVEAYMKTKNRGPKGWNNLRGNLHAFFKYCSSAPRGWLVGNPVASIQKFRIARGIPEILSAVKVAELFAFLETYSGGPRSSAQKGCLIPYFALCTFAGIRPSVPRGEVWKIGMMPDAAKIIDLDTGVIRIGPAIAKTKDLRQVMIQPNLRAWLTRYPVKDYPIVVPNMQSMVTDVRNQFSIGEDVLRHTFISFHVARFRSLGGTALESGNSETIIKKHYLNMVTETESDMFWRTLPSGSGAHFKVTN